MTIAKSQCVHKGIFRVEVFSSALALILLVMGCESDSGETTTDPDGSTTSSTSGQPDAGCENFLACVAKTQPSSLPDAQMLFGEKSECWQGSVMASQQCVDACRSGQEMSHDAWPDEPSCFTCMNDEDCGAGMACYNGGCNMNCGNGVIDPGEICDAPDSCWVMCDGPAACSPLTNAGCKDGEHCRFTTDAELVYTGLCSPSSGVGGYGANCYGPLDCAPGLDCVGRDSIPVDCPGAGDGCCTVACDVAVPDTCPEGTSCSPFYGMVDMDESLRYLGLCIIPV